MKLFNVKYPAKKSNLTGKRYTQAEVVLGLLQINGSVTTKLLNAAGIKNPSIVIRNLRSQGVEIETKLVDVKCSNGVVRKSMAEYSLANNHSNKGGK